MAVADRVRVWVQPDLDVQHFAEAPEGSPVMQSWEGESVCGRAGQLRWVHWEVVDEGATCPDCIAVEGTYRPLLEGDYAGPP